MHDLLLPSLPDHLDENPDGVAHNSDGTHEIKEDDLHDDATPGFDETQRGFGSA